MSEICLILQETVLDLYLSRIKWLWNPALSSTQELTLIYWKRD